MPWDGSGNFTLTQDFPADRDLGRPDSLIDANKFDEEFENLRIGLENCLALDGQNSPLSDIPMGGYSFTGMRAAAESDEPILAEQVSSGELDWIGLSGGTANAITGSLTFAPTLAAGVRVRGVATNTNTGACTFSLNGGAATAIKRFNGDTPVSGDITAGRPFELLFDGTSWRITSLQTGTIVDAEVLDNLDDVVITSPSVKQTLRYNGSIWENALLLLDDLSDVGITAPANGHALKYNGTNWINSLLDLDALSDVSISAPSNGHSLKYNGSTWVNALLDLDGLSDVAITTPSDAHTLRHNGSGWVNSLLSIDDLAEVVLGTPSAGHVLGYNGSNWISRTIASALGYTPANVAGDTFTGDVTVSKTTPVFDLNKASSGQAAIIRGRQGGNTRWALTLGDTTAESGSNVGSDLAIDRYDDAGSVIATALTIARSTGVANFASMPTVGGVSLSTTFQAADSDLTTWAGLTPSANAQSLVTAANYAAMRSLLSLVVGTNVQAWSANLDSWSAIATSTKQTTITPTNGMSNPPAVGTWFFAGMSGVSLAMGGTHAASDSTNATRVWINFTENSDPTTGTKITSGTYTVRGIFAVRAGGGTMQPAYLFERTA